MNRRYLVLLLVLLSSALALGHYGTWMAAYLAGNTTHATVDTCVVAYGWNEFRYARCDGNWHHTTTQGDSRYLVGTGPIIGLHVDAAGPVVGPDGKLAGNYQGTYFVVLRDGAGWVVTDADLVIGPLSLVLALASGILLTRVRRGHREAAP